MTAYSWLRNTLTYLFTVKDGQAVYLSILITRKTDIADKIIDFKTYYRSILISS